PGDNHRLLAAVLASGVSLSVYAIYQYVDEMPALRQEFASQSEKLREQLAQQGIALEAQDPRLSRRIQEDNVYATYAHPNAFAGYLALLLPAAVGAFLV